MDRGERGMNPVGNNIGLPGNRTSDTPHPPSFQVLHSTDRAIQAQRKTSIQLLIDPIAKVNEGCIDYFENIQSV